MDSEKPAETLSSQERQLANTHLRMSAILDKIAKSDDDTEEGAIFRGLFNRLCKKGLSNDEVVLYRSGHENIEGSYYFKAHGNELRYRCNGDWCMYLNGGNVRVGISGPGAVFLDRGTNKDVDTINQVLETAVKFMEDYISSETAKLAAIPPSLPDEDNAKLTGSLLNLNERNRFLPKYVDDQWVNGYLLSTSDQFDKSISRRYNPEYALDDIIKALSELEGMKVKIGGELANEVGANLRLLEECIVTKVEFAGKQKTIAGKFKIALSWVQRLIDNDGDDPAPTEMIQRGSQLLEMIKSAKAKLESVTDAAMKENVSDGYLNAVIETAGIFSDRPLKYEKED